MNKSQLLVKTIKFSKDGKYSDFILGTALASIKKHYNTLNDADVVNQLTMLLESESTNVLLVTDTSMPEDDNYVAYLAYSLTPAPFLFCAYVKFIFRRQGIFKALLHRAFNHSFLNEPIYLFWNTKAIEHLREKYNLIVLEGANA